MQLLDDALEEVRPSIENAFRNSSYGELYHVPGDRRPEGYHTVRLRLDLELSDETLHGASEGELADLVLSIIAPDLEDLIINGDVYNFKDALLMAMDGAKKRLAKPVEIKITSFFLYGDHKERKASTEFTAYLLMAVKWQPITSSSD